MIAKTEVYLYKDDPTKAWKKPGQTGNDSKLIHVVQGEAGSEELEFHLGANSMPLDLTGKTVTFYLTKPDGRQIFMAADIPDDTAKQGIASAVLTAQCTAASGMASHGEIRVTAEDSSVMKFRTPDLYISASDTENAVESTSEFHALDAAINKAENSLKNSESALNSAQTILTGDRQAVADAVTAAVNAGAKADAANQAADCAAAAAQTADTAADTAAKSSQSADAAAQKANAAASSCEVAVSNLSSVVTAQINAQKGISGGIAAYDSMQSHLTDQSNPHGVTALQIGVCNRNLLTDGNIQVWQEAENFTGLTGNRYTATMWQTWQNTGASYSVQKAGPCGGMIIKNNSASTISVSLVTLVEKGTVKPGCIYTVSAKGLRNGAAFTTYLADYGKAPFTYKILTEECSLHVFTAPDTLDSHFFVSIEIGNLAAGASAEIDSVKLEESGQFTGFYTEQYADVFARTLRYYQRGFDYHPLTLANPYTVTASMFIPLHYPMRTIPAVSIVPGADITGSIGVNWDSDVTPTNFRCLDSRNGGFILCFDNAVLNKQYFLKKDIIQADARL